MPEHQTTLIGAPCWIELFTSDPGWTAESAGEEFGGYVNIGKDGRRVAGGMKNDGQSGAPDAWSVYLATDDAAATATAAVDHGGQVIVPPMPVMDLGTMAVLTDAGGAAIGAWQGGTHLGFEASGEPGTPCWFELHTRDYEASIEFYRQVFGWHTHVEADSPEFRYTTLVEGETQHAGIMDAVGFLPEGVPARWSISFGVDDADAALARIVDLGGAVVRTAEDSPYGRLAEATDPTGAHFKLVAGT